MQSNPVGCGDTQGFLGAQQGNMPNINYPESAFSLSWKHRVAIGYGPIGIDNVVRKKKFGSYNKAWLKQDAPGFAQDIDWSIFNVAPEDQWAKQFFQGGEKYCLKNLHPQNPLIQGELPKLQARAFILQNEQLAKEATEIPMQMDTVWFLPEYDLGVVIYHGKTEVSDSDALDVKVAMVAYENIGEPKSIDHYRSVMALRLDKTTATQNVFNDSQLAPNHSAAELARRKKTQYKCEQGGACQESKKVRLIRCSILEKARYSAASQSQTSTGKIAYFRVNDKTNSD